MGSKSNSSAMSFDGISSIDIASALSYALSNRSFDSTNFSLGVGLPSQYYSAPIQNILQHACAVKFSHGQSNPTFLVKIDSPSSTFPPLVLRKKPPGVILQSAHAIEREFQTLVRIYKHNTSNVNGRIPIPTPYFICTDEAIIGTPFYIMEFIDGRIFKTPLSFINQIKCPNQRRDMIENLVVALAKMHSMPVSKKQESSVSSRTHIQRQIERWSIQYEKSHTSNDDFERMMNLSRDLELYRVDKLKENGLNEFVALIHGDFRMDNVVFHPSNSQIVAILDWELSSIGNPWTDLASLCMFYHNPYSNSKHPESSHNTWFNYSTLKNSTQEGIPSQTSLVYLYISTIRRHLAFYRLPRGFSIESGFFHMNYYQAFCAFRIASILQGVYWRSLHGNASSVTLNNTNSNSKWLSQLSYQYTTLSRQLLSAQLLSSSNNLVSNALNTLKYELFLSLSNHVYSTLSITSSNVSEDAWRVISRVESFIFENILELESELDIHLNEKKESRFVVFPKMEELKQLAKMHGLWNLWLPKSVHSGRFTNVEYALMAEATGKSFVLAPEAFNCSAPDTGNAELLARFGTESQKELWLKPLLDGSIRSCFAMTEPNVASSDATNIQAKITRHPVKTGVLVVSGTKWWTSGALDPRCAVILFLGKHVDESATDTKYSKHSILIIPMHLKGIKVKRALHVYGYDDAPHGHAEVEFSGVEVNEKDAVLLGIGRGFEAAQRRLGPGRIHHCMRLLGMAERALCEMKIRACQRSAFGKLVAHTDRFEENLAQCRMRLDQARLLTLSAAHGMDTSEKCNGSGTVLDPSARKILAMTKVVVPNVACEVIDIAIQTHGALGVSQDRILAHMWASARSLRLADGPDVVHEQVIAKTELNASPFYNLSKL